MVLATLFTASCHLNGVALFSYYASIGCDPRKARFINKNDEVVVTIKYFYCKQSMLYLVTISVGIIFKVLIINYSCQVKLVELIKLKIRKQNV